MREGKVGNPPEKGLPGGDLERKEGGRYNEAKLTLGPCPTTSTYVGAPFAVIKSLDQRSFLSNRKEREPSAVGIN